MERKKIVAELLRFTVLLCAFIFVNGVTPARAQVLIATAMKKIIKSTDGGKSWTTVWDSDMDSRIPGAQITSITQGNGKILASGDVLVVSSDGGTTWKEISIVGDTKNNLLKKYSSVVGFGDGMFVLASPFRMLYSVNGLTWQYVKDPAIRVTNGSQADPPGMREAADIMRYPRSINFIDGKFFVSGGSQQMEMAILIKDGEQLRLQKKFDLFSEYGNSATTPAGLGRMATNGKEIVVVTEGSTKSGYSTDGGSTWKFIKNPEDKFTNSVAFGNGIFVTCNGFGEVMYTNDIIKGWIGASKFYEGQMTGNRIFFDGARFMVFCHDQEIFVSKDGKMWTKLNSKATYTNHIYDAIVLK